MKRISGKNLVLVGFMGTGKTEVGRLLAESLSRKFIDTDRMLEKQEGMPVRAIFREQGESYFRKREADVVADVAAQRGLVISTGGGVVLNPENVARLKESGFVVWLDADIAELKGRLAGDTTRPLLQGDAELKELYLRRRPNYESAAHQRVDTTGKSPLAVVAEIVELLRGE